jgi:hypothetical protein
MTIARAFWCWDRVWIGCGASKRAGRSPALELYTGPLEEPAPSSLAAGPEQLGLDWGGAQ